MAKTYNEILASLKSNMTAKRSDIETTEGTVISDIFEADADQIEDMYVDIAHIGVLGSFKYWDKMSKEELDDKAFDYGLTRKPATKSSGIVYFRTSTRPTQNILIPKGQTITTEPDEKLKKIYFVTTEEKILEYANVDDYYNTDSGYWEIGVNVESVEIGSENNIGVGSIKLIEGSITGIENIYNYQSFSNGQDEETNEDFASRCLIALQGTAMGTELAYVSQVMKNINVDDALIVKPGDPLMVRDNGMGGKIDIYVKINEESSDVWTEVEDEFVYNGEITKTLNNQPVKEIVSVIGSVSGTLSESDYKLNKDTGVFKNSKLATDNIEFLTALQSGETITIKYKYFNILSDLTDEIEAVRPITADILIKLADKAYIDVDVLVYADNSITDLTEFANSVQTEIESYLSLKNLDGSIEQADIVSLIYNVAGVDNVKIPFNKLARQGQTGVADIDIGKNEYSLPGTIKVIAEFKTTT